MVERHKATWHLVSAVALLTGCGFTRGVPEVRYRVSVEVEDNGVLRSGGSVWSWTLSKPDVALASAYDGKFAGEAVAVDLKGGRTLFAVLRGSDGDQGAAQMLPERLFGDVGRDLRGEPRRFASDRIADLRDIASRSGERQVIDCAARPSMCPMLVTLTDPTNPQSMQEVDPLALGDTFGPGVRLNRIVVEITNDPVPVVIEEKFGWLKGHLGSFVKRPKNTPIGNMPLAGQLHDGDFKQGIL